MKKFTDVSFPRGNSKKITKRPINTNKDDLFKTSVDDAKPPAKKKRRRKTSETNDVEREEPVILENPNFQIYGAGFTVLGCVKEIKELSVTVELPGGLLGSIPITGVSQVYTDLLRKSVNDADVAAASLDDIYEVGQLLPCSIVAASEDATNTRKSISVTTDPYKVNADFSSSLLRHGMLISAVVINIEDHGYEMDVGIKGVKAFLKKEECDPSSAMENLRELSLGQVVQCMVYKPDAKNPAARISGRIVNLTIHPEKLNTAMTKPNMNINLHALIPGMLLSCQITKVTRDGLLIKSLQYDGCVPKMYLKSPLSQPRDYAIDEKICGRLLYIHPVMKTLYVTFTEPVVKSNQVLPQDIFSGHHVGDIVEDAVVTSVDKHGVYLNVKGCAAFCKKSELSDTNLTEISSKEFPVGSTHRCRVFGLKLMTATLQVTMKKSILEQSIFNAQDIEVGEAYECTVLKIVAAGVVVKISPTLNGFIPSLHLSDVHLSHPEKHFKIGQKLQCRVLSVELSDKKTIKLTNKASLVKTKNPLIASFDRIQRGLISDGYIVNVDNNRLIVSFYNNIAGCIKGRNLGIEKGNDASEIFQKGQVVRCQVLHVDKQNRKLTLTFQIRENNLPDDDPSLEMGKIVTVRVVNDAPDGLNVTILPKEVPAVLHTKHLSDNLHLCSMLRECCGPGTELEAVMFSKRRAYIVSAKLSLLQAARNNELVHNYSDVNEGMILPGVITNIVKYGVFVQLSNNVSGLVPKKNMESLGLDDDDDGSLYEINQSVIVKVTKFDEEKERIELSLKMKDVYSGEVSSSVDYLISYVTAMNRILQHYAKMSGEQQQLSKLYVGCVVKVKVTKMMKSGFIGTIKGNVQCICTAEHYGDLNFKEGDEILGVVLYINASDCTVQVTATPSIVGKVNDYSDNWHSRVIVNQKMKADVVFIHNNYILVMLRGHANGKVAFLPNRKHLNDKIGRTSLFSLFHVYPICVQRILEDNKIIVTLDAHDSRPKLTAKKLTEKRKSDSSPERPKRARTESTCSDISIDVECGGKIKKHDLKLGSIYGAVVRSIKAMQMNILVNGKVPGRIHVSEACDSIVEGQNPLEQFKVGQNLRVRIISFREINTKSFLPITHRNFTQALPDCSIKRSVLEDDDYKCQESAEVICAGQDVVGYFKSYANSCLWFRITPKLDARIYVLNFSTDPKVLSHVESLKPGAAYHATVVSVGSHIQMTRTGTHQVNEGATIIGKVLSTRSTVGSLLRLPLGYRGYVDLTDTSDSFQSASVMLEELLSKSYVRCCILEINHRTKECVLSTRDSRTRRNFKKAVRDRELMDVSDVAPGDVLRGFIKSTTRKKVIVKLGRQLDGFILKETIPSHALTLIPGNVVDLKVISVGEDNEAVDLQLLNVEDEGTSTEEENGLAGTMDAESLESTTIQQESDGNEKSRKTGAKSRIGESTGFIWDSNMDLLSANAAQDGSSSSGDEEEEVTKKRKRRTARLEREEELNLHEKERLLLESGDSLPRDVDSFDRAVLSSPNSSIIWLQYMAFHLEKAEIEKARAVASRALKTISFREEQEKFNIWVSLLNLENLYGTPETLKEVLQQALTHCDQIMVYNKLISIYVSTNKINEAETLYNVLLKKFHQQKQVWVDFGSFLLKNNQADKARNLMQRALKSLDKKDHIDILSKFAQNEISNGDVERGKTMFDNVLSTYPKRTDLWSVYIDLLINFGDIGAVRQVLDRALKLKLPVKKMKFFFKKYIALEEKFGTPEAVEAVKEKVVDFIEKS